MSLFCFMDIQYLPLKSSGHGNHFCVVGWCKLCNSSLQFQKISRTKQKKKNVTALSCLQYLTETHICPSALLFSKRRSCTTDVSNCIRSWITLCASIGSRHIALLLICMKLSSSLNLSQMVDVAQIAEISRNIFVATNHCERLFSKSTYMAQLEVILVVQVGKQKIALTIVYLSKALAVPAA